MVDPVPRSHPVPDLVDVAARVPCVEMVDKSIPLIRPLHWERCDVEVAHDRLSEIVHAVLEVCQVDIRRLLRRVVVRVEALVEHVLENITVSQHSSVGTPTF